MQLIDYSIKWHEGEITIGKCAIAFGTINAITALLLWRLGESPNAKSLVLPVLLCAFLLSATGGGMVYSGIARKTEFLNAYEQSPDEFLHSETERNAKSVKMYPYSPVICAAIFLIAMLTFALSVSPTVRGWCIAAMFIAFALTVTDFFSQENGERYQQELRLFQD